MKTKYNQKHITLSQRIMIEKGLVENKSFSKIAREIGKDPTTVSKEVRRHSKAKERPDADYTSTPCINRKSCTISGLCDEQCGRRCKICRRPKFKCIDVCPNYKVAECEKLKKAPYVCNGCGKKTHCLMIRRFYSSKYANDTYRNMLVSSREGINQTPESIQRMNDLLTPLLGEKKQSIAHVYATHAEDLGCSRRTLYTYIHKSVFEIRALDLRRAVKYKKRKAPTQCSSKDRSYRQGHNYEDFLKYTKEHPDTPVVEMDCVEGTKGGKVLLTMLFRNCNLMLLFLLDNQDQECVSQVFVWLETLLGVEGFKKTFPVILTDGGSEFAAREDLENACNGSKMTTVYYCDPYCFWQKGMLEKNHEYIRYVLPKGESFDELTTEQVTLLMNHINSEKRDSLNGHSPFELSLFLLDKTLHSSLKLIQISPDDVCLAPKLLK
jgi:Transposase and inactivated derivatives, IS30 family